MTKLTRKTDSEGRVALPAAFANCVVTIEWEGDELRIRKTRKAPRRYSFKELMAGVTPENLHQSLDDGPTGKEIL